jgi:phosphoribosylformylglycinamidine (FGAM) synthase-like enzyme
MAMGGRLGVVMSQHHDHFTQLFSESLGRVVIEVQPQHEATVAALFDRCEVIAKVDNSPMFILSDGSKVAIETLLNSWTQQ